MPGYYTPQLQETMTRLGAKMPFEQAVEEVWRSQRTKVKEGTLRATTYRHGEAAEAIERAKVEQLEKEALTSRPAAKAEAATQNQEQSATTSGKKMFVSSDGSFVHLRNGDWYEVKSMVVGEFASRWHAKKSKIEVKTSDLSYFSRSYRVREFERYALAELERRGVEQAQKVITVNDGATWIENFNSYHIPQAISILDFTHALNHIADAGKLVLGEANPQFSAWLQEMASQLKHKPPAETLNTLALLKKQLTDEEKIAAFEMEYRYLETRLKQIDYPHFRAQQYPIGSGSVESGHKVVVQSRMKQAGMRWAKAHIDPLLALRNLVCNQRWSQGWAEIPAFYWQQRRRAWQQQAQPQQPPSKPITLASIKVAPSPPKPDAPPPPSQQPYRPALDHPWRLGLWPSREAWRWN